MFLLYAATLFLSAMLLFMVQPLFARMLLPVLGGSPSVWNTALVFYQAALLAGYLYAHLVTTRLRPRQQIGLHAAMLLLPLLTLPLGLPAGWEPPATSNPVLWLLSLLLVTIGLPFFVVSTSSPLLQSWFVRTGGSSAGNPYVLYAASNVGSLLALLIYPVLMEPLLGLASQSLVWSAGYVLLVAMVLLCARTIWHAPASPAPEAPAAPLDDQPVGAGATSTAPETPTMRRRLRWALLAFVPSSLMISVTTYLSTNIAPLPLLWVIPLGIFLLTFILVFARRPLLPHALVARAVPIVVIPLALVMVLQASQPIEWLIGLHLLAFFIIAMACHGTLAQDRPAPRYLTEFYFWMSLGGVMGGIFNSLVAPLLFNGLFEYQIVLVVAMLVQPRPAQGAETSRRRALDLALPAALAALTVGLVLGVQRALPIGSPLAMALMFALPMVLCFSFSRRPLRFGLGLAAIFLGGLFYISSQGEVVHSARSFFGIHRVFRDPSGQFHLLSHGSTIHGKQHLGGEDRLVPLTYYFPTGPAGQLFSALGGAPTFDKVAVVGLGAGSLACYQRPGQDWTFYEIDPDVERIAREPAYFSYMRECAPDDPVVLGDARLSLRDAPAQGYDVIVLDAYSSDSIPIHLITREALRLYLEKLAPDGVLAFHISNVYLDLHPVLNSLAQDAGLTLLVQDDLTLAPGESARGKTASQWAIMARRPESFGPLAADARWRALPASTRTREVWTDDFSSLLSILK